MIRIGTSIGGVAGFVIVLGLGLALNRGWERSVISGATAAQQVTENVKVADWMLSAEERTKIINVTISA